MSNKPYAVIHDGGIVQKVCAKGDDVVYREVQS